MGFLHPVARKVRSMRTVEDYSLSMAFLKKACAKKVVLHESSEDIQKILSDHPKLVVAMNHGPLAGPLAGSIAMMDQYSKNDGNKRVPMIIAWRGFYHIPMVKHLIRYISQVKMPFNLDGFVKQVTDKGVTDLFVMPEGENCTYGNGLDIEPFLSPRFVELALKANTPILIAVHTGSERWSNIVPVSRKLNPLLKYLPAKSYQRLKETGQVNMAPLRLSAIPELQVSYKLYQPEMTVGDLGQERSLSLLQKEADAIRSLMQGIVGQMTAPDNSESVSPEQAWLGAA